MLVVLTSVLRDEHQPRVLYSLSLSLSWNLLSALSSGGLTRDVAASPPLPPPPALSRKQLNNGPVKVMSAGEAAVPGPLMVNSTHVSGCRPHSASVQLSAPPPQEQEKTLPFSSWDSTSVGMRDDELQFVAETNCAPCAAAVRCWSFERNGKIAQRSTTIVNRIRYNRCPAAWDQIASVRRWNILQRKIRKLHNKEEKNGKEPQENKWSLDQLAVSAEATIVYHAIYALSPSR